MLYSLLRGIDISLEHVYREVDVIGKQRKLGRIIYVDLFFQITKRDLAE